MRVTDCYLTATPTLQATASTAFRGTLKNRIFLVRQDGPADFLTRSGRNRPLTTRLLACHT